MKLLLMLLASCAGTLVPLQAGAATAQAGLKVIVIDGDEAANIVAERLAAVPVIEVRDKDDRRVPGAVVRFLIRKTARNRLAAVFRNGQAEVRTITDAAGQANSSAITPLETGPFEIEVEVRAPGQTGNATIRQTNFRTAADAKAAGREPGKSSNSNAQASNAAGTAGASAGAAAGATAATTTATSAAVSAGGGMSKLAVVGLLAGGAAGAGAAVVLTQRESDPPAGRVSALTVSQAVGVEGATAFTFSVQAIDFDATSLAYRWEFGDGGVSSEAAPTHTYNAAGTYTVVVTVNDARQSARSEMSVVVRTLSGTWLGSAVGNSVTTMQISQSGSSLAGLLTIQFSGPAPLVYTDCPISGSLQSGSPVAVTLTSPRCPHPTAGRFAERVVYNLTVGADGQTLSGTENGEFSGTNPISLRRQ